MTILIIIIFLTLSISFIPEMVNCFNLLIDFLRQRKHIAIVVDEYSGLAVDVIDK